MRRLNRKSLFVGGGTKNKFFTNFPVLTCSNQKGYAIITIHAEIGNETSFVPISKIQDMVRET